MKKSNAKKIVTKPAKPSATPRKARETVASLRLKIRELENRVSELDLLRASDADRMLREYAQKTEALRNAASALEKQLSKAHETNGHLVRQLNLLTRDLEAERDDKAHGCPLPVNPDRFKTWQDFFRANQPGRLPGMPSPGFPSHDGPAVLVFSMAPGGFAQMQNGCCGNGQG